MSAKSKVVSGSINYVHRHLHTYTYIQVPLGIIPKNENKLDEMVEIMSQLHQYVPAKEYNKEVFVEGACGVGTSVNVQDAVLHPLLFGGDQLTAARARGAKRIKMNGISPMTRLEGLIPCAEDWHAKVNLLEVYTVLHNTIIILYSLLCCI